MFFKKGEKIFKHENKNGSGKNTIFLYLESKKLIYIKMNHIYQIARHFVDSRIVQCEKRKMIKVS